MRTPTQPGAGPMAMALIAMMILGSSPAVLAAGDASIRGRVLASDSKTPLVGISVRAFKLETGEIVEGRVSDAKGRYQIDGLTEGEYDLVFVYSGRSYLSNRVVAIPGSGRVQASFALFDREPGEGEWWRPQGNRGLPGTEEAPDGEARYLVHDRKPFFKTRGGMATLIGGGAAALALLLSGGGGDGDDDRRASPSQP